jgi:hypothetical protein
MKVEEARAILLAFIEKSYGSQEVMRLADDYAFAVLEEALMDDPGLATIKAEIRRKVCR